jgi:hypothetical protein
MSIISILNKLSDILNNRVNNVIYDFLIIEPLKLIDKEYDEISKHTHFTFANDRLLDHKNLFVALFARLASQEEFFYLIKQFLS